MQVDGRKKESCGETLGTEGQAQVGSQSWGRKRQDQEREAFLGCGHDSDNADRELRTGWLARPCLSG